MGTFPPLEEQIAIADFLQVELNYLAETKDKLRNAIDRLQEYRSALITAAVTGKIDVRNYTGD